MSSGVADTTAGSGALDRVAEILGWKVRSEGEGGGSGDPATRLWALPRAEEPRILIPADPKIARSALRTFNDSMSQFARLRKGGLGELLRLRLDRMLRLDAVEMRPDLIAGEPALVQYLSDVLGRAVQLGVALGPELRPNAKPVLQLIGRNGELVAFAKIGWNDITRPLVDNEASSLRALEERQPSSFDVPEVLHHGVWAGRAVLVVSPGPRPLIRRCRRNAPPGVQVEGEVAGSGWSMTEPLGSGAYIAGLGPRVAAASAAGRIDLGQVLEGIVDRWGHVPLPFGAWHGDWAPWNMSRSRGRLFVWDWERYGGPVPRGLDHVHFGFQLSYQVARRGVEEAAREADRSLRSSGLSAPIAGEGLGPVTRLYLIERILRVEEGAVAGVPVRSDLAPAAFEVLTESAP